MHTGSWFGVPVYGLLFASLATASVHHWNSGYVSGVPAFTTPSTHSATAPCRHLQLPTSHLPPTTLPPATRLRTPPTACLIARCVCCVGISPTPEPLLTVFFWCAGLLFAVCFWFYCCWESNQPGIDMETQGMNRLFKPLGKKFKTIVDLATPHMAIYAMKSLGGSSGVVGTMSFYIANYLIIQLIVELMKTLSRRYRPVIVSSRGPLHPVPPVLGCLLGLHDCLHVLCSRVSVVGGRCLLTCVCHAHAHAHARATYRPSRSSCKAPCGPFRRTSGS